MNYLRIGRYFDAYKNHVLTATKWFCHLIQSARFNTRSTSIFTSSLLLLSDCHAMVIAGRKSGRNRISPDPEIIHEISPDPEIILPNISGFRGFQNFTQLKTLIKMSLTFLDRIQLYRMTKHHILFQKMLWKI